ncbi:hypothetical protein AA0113_g12556 [Alternaria arborescens]|uniref:Zn(2)-C6 fungal-type domain-containing protein n=2 Tax=Alternaria sect. Alternaria TaxID=2499237 RepID=A0A4Q4PWU0_9PLEO|nr:hypothetical protein AA0112_g12617 [Alternaria arborescens]RYN85674.1 hypothetical protein AA0119_g13231 [Alternaria tenuissima]RYO03154.1 hypothetical protein AA0121_g13166 [Alternaria tenuissima]RYO26136.1 hypothetical protein AA0113_g12556 [Alternaria arborescens]RYO48351.1 hypothetical protein AA0116_g12749 [Alternaria tenuissima]
MTGQSITPARGPRQVRGRRTNNACLRCRDRKVKCSGTRPCIACSRRSLECIFSPHDKKVLISESYLEELRHKSGREDPGVSILETTAERLQSHPSNSATPPWNSGNLASSHNGAAGSAQSTHEEESSALRVSAERTEAEDPDLRNPLTTTSPAFVMDSMGKRHWLGPSSTWAYSQQVIRLLRSHLNIRDRNEAITSVDAQAFTLDWPSVRGSMLQQKADIPSRDYAIYLTNTVKFHLGQTYHLFEESHFLAGVHEYYNCSTLSDATGQTRLWHVQFLLVMALGQALLAPVTSGKSPASNNLVARALDLLPDAHGLYRDPIISIELLCCLSLYLQSIDHRNSAYLYIGQALRIALTQGLHREHDMEHLSEKEDTRLRNIWWTCYILDRKFSSLMGAPSSVHDDDVTVPLPRPIITGDRFDALAIHVRVSKILTQVLNRIYNADGKFNSSVLRHVKDVLQETVKLSPELAVRFPLESDHSGSVSRVSATLNLCFHQCIVLAARPILISLMEDVLVNHRNQHDIAGPIKAVLKAASRSARTSLHILSSLQSQHLLELFLPFDLEQTFSSVSALTMISALPLTPDFGYKEYADIATSVFETMASRGNRVAGFRNDDLTQLQEAAWRIQAHSRASPTRSLNSDVCEVQQESEPANIEPAEDHLEAIEALGTSQYSSSATNESSELLPIATFLQWEPTFLDLPSEQFPDDWLWTDIETSTFGYNAPL